MMMQGSNPERSLSRDESEAAERQTEEQGKRAQWKLILENPMMKARGGTKDDNRNNLIRFDLIHYPLGRRRKKFPVSQQRP